MPPSAFFSLLYMGMQPKWCWHGHVGAVYRASGAVVVVGIIARIVSSLCLPGVAGWLLAPAVACQAARAAWLIAGDDDRPLPLWRGWP